MSARPLLAAVAALALAPLFAAPAVASDVANDLIAGAVHVTGALPQTASQDTTAADITDADDVYFEGSCALAFAVERTVWFSYTDVTGEGFAVDPSASDFDSSVAIFEGDPRAGGTMVACGEDEVAARGGAGQQYLVAGFSDKPAPYGVGGTLVLTFRQLMPAPTTPVLTVDPTATVQPDLSTVVTGSYACANAGSLPYHRTVSGMIGSDNERIRPRSYFRLEDLTCDGQVRPWRAVARSFDGVPYSGGRSTVNAVLVAAGDLATSVNEVKQPILGVRAR